jgi:hypothetical protein
VMPYADLDIYYETPDGVLHWVGASANEFGYYRVLGIPNGAYLTVYAYGWQVMQPCAVNATYPAASGIALDVTMYSEAVLLAGTNPPNDQGPVVYGTVRMASNNAPVPRAYLYIDEYLDTPSAVTRSDDTGHYWFCRVPNSVFIGGYIETPSGTFSAYEPLTGITSNTEYTLRLR